MPISVYILKNNIVKSSVDEYLKYKAQQKEKKRLAAQADTSPAPTTQKFKKDRRTVFISTSDTAAEALSLAGISYEGEIALEDIEFCKVETQQKCMCGNLCIPKLNDVTGPNIQMYFS